ncbi:MAG: hypothetical protein GXP37_04605 [Chloroflexi bacterium]|nr:hypothetical protein [Chloroflexota bacterium]
MNDQSYQNDLSLLVGYLLTSAHGLYEEPPGYGPFRLLDTAGRLLAIMAAHGLDDPFFLELKERIDAERSGHSSEEELRATLDELCQQYARELTKRYSLSEEHS